MSDVHNHVVETERIGKLHVYVQGRTNAERQTAKPNCCFLCPLFEQYLPSEINVIRDSAANFRNATAQIENTK